MLPGLSSHPEESATDRPAALEQKYLFFLENKVWLAYYFLMLTSFWMEI